MLDDSYCSMKHYILFGFKNHPDIILIDTNITIELLN